MTEPSHAYVWHVVIEPAATPGVASPTASLTATFEPPAGDFYSACGWAMDMCDPMIGNHGEPAKLTIERIALSEV